MNISSLFLPEPSEVSLSGRVRDDAMKKLLAKQMGTFAENAPRFDVETGTIKGKKQKRRRHQLNVRHRSSKPLKRSGLAFALVSILGVKLGILLGHSVSP